MTTPTGTINAGHINSELGRPSTQLLSLNDSAVRALAGVPSGTISYDNLRGKSSFSASGGNYITTPGNGYKYHTFTSPGTFAVTGSRAVDILVVGGGGGGGNTDNSNGGGGGAGGLIYIPGFNISTASHAVTIGAGGAGSNNGGHTTFGPGTPAYLIAYGGGHGGGGPRGSMYNASPGGSGGGGSGFDQDTAAGTGSQPTAPGNSGTYGYGNAGTAIGSYYADGGGGAGGPAVPGSLQYAVDGGSGRQYPGFTGPLIGVPALNPLSGYYAGGGGGGYGGAGGAGGGGAGSPHGGVGNGYSAVTNSGGGGGGSYGFQFYYGGNGGPGIVVIRYAV